MIYKEQELFGLLHSIFRGLVTTKRMSFADCYSHSDKAVIELKCRRTHYDDLIIERKKYKRLLRLAADSNYTAYYIVSTPKGVWSFNLNQVKEPEWVYKAQPKTTDFRERHFIKKEVGFLNIKDGKRLFTIQ